MNFYETSVFPFLNDLATKEFEHFRQELFSQAFGDVLEVGIGSGLGHKFYSDKVDKIVGIDPNPGMISKAKEKINDSRFELCLGQCEDLPFEDQKFDFVISFLVLCSVANLELSLVEMKRVLKPNGKILFLEHIAPEGRIKSLLFDSVNPLWKIPACGCNLNRKTIDIMEKVGFVVSSSKIPQKNDSFIPFVWGHAE